MWRIRKDGGLARADRAAHAAAQPAEVPPSKTKTYTLLGVARGTSPRSGAATLEAPDTTVNSVPDLIRRAAIVVLGTFALVSILAVFCRSPLEEPANALVTPNPAKAPWYFLWLQEIVTDTTFQIGSFTVNGAFLGGVLLPGALILLLTVWPWLDRSPARRGRPLVPAEPQDAERRLPRALRPRRHRPDGRRDVPARPLLALLLAVAAVAGAAGEDLTWKSAPTRPIPKKDRPILAVIGVLLIVSTVLFAWSDRKHDWRYYQFALQAAGRREVRRREGEDVSRPGVAADLGRRTCGRADRCITCHQAVYWKGFETAEEPYRSHPAAPLKNHPIERFGCTVVPRRAGLRGGRRRGARPGRALGGAAPRDRRSARPTRSRRTRRP